MTAMTAMTAFPVLVDSIIQARISASSARTRGCLTTRKSPKQIKNWP
jgi:hypothetical protein